MHKFFILIHLLYFSTCFEHYYAHLQEGNCIITASAIVSLVNKCIKIKNLCIKLLKKAIFILGCTVNKI